MAMQMLDAGGLDVVTDGVREAGADNPKGYYEDERVKDLHKSEEGGNWIKDSRGKAIKIISFLLRNLPDTNNYKVIFMRRDLGEVLASQSKMLERRGEPNETSDEEMMKLWQDHLWKVNYFLKHTPHVDAIEVVYRDAVSDPIGQASRIRDFVGHQLDLESMVRTVDPDLYRNRRAKSE